MADDGEHEDEWGELCEREADRINRQLDEAFDDEWPDEWFDEVPNG